MRRRHSVDAKLTRRRLVAGGVAGAIALTGDPVAAQRCPATPPTRPKGLPVWLDLDQQDLDEAYDQNVYAFNFKSIAERRAANNATALAVIGRPERAAHGATDIEKVDIYRTRRPHAPIMVFIHGGGWRNGRSADFALFAEVFVKAGANFVAVDFTNVVETKGDLFPMVDQCRRAVAWTYRHAASFDGDANAIYLCSRSSGGHLASSNRSVGIGVGLLRPSQRHCHGRHHHRKRNPQR